MEGLGSILSEWILGATCFILFLIFVWMNRNGVYNYEEGTPQNNSSTRCDSPNCVRCSDLCTTHNLALVQKNRMEKYDQFCKKTTFNASPASESYASILKVKGLINSARIKHSIHRSIFVESGYELDDETNLLPHVWMFPGLRRHAFWSSHFHPSLQDIVNSLEDLEIFRAIENEFRFVNGSKQGWKLNSIPFGRWKVFYLYNQGKINRENCAKCPRTMHFLRTIEISMQDHIFGNAMFSILEPGSCIEPHIGPCNYRLRCHLPLIIPSGYAIKVGRETSVWEEGKLMIFDDSFVHEVWSKLAEGLKIGSECDIGRAVLIFDIWHPQVTCLEKAAIKHIFN